MNFTKVFEFESLIGDVYGVFKYEDFIEVSDSTFSQKIKEKNSRYGEENHTRTVYKIDDFYIKVWDVDYIRANTISAAFASGFYDSTIIPNFVGLLYDENNNCRGYIAKESTPSEEHFEELFKRIKLKTINTNYFAYDFCKNHTYEFEGKPTLIDLEGIYRIDEYDNLSKHHYETYLSAGNFIEDNTYKTFIENYTSLIPINLETFFDMKLQHGSGGKEIIHNDKKITTVGEAVRYFSEEKNRKEAESKLDSKNHQYWNCMWAEFKRDAGDHHALGWENMTKEYYDSLESMPDDEIQLALIENPVEFYGGILKHGYHRGVAMMGRILNGKEYIPFYIPKQTISNPISNVNFIEMMDIMGFSKEEYAICNSAILAVMGVDARKNKNGDLDLVFSSKLRKQIEDENIELPKEIHPFGKDSGKFRFFGCKDDDDLVYNYSVNINGYNFAEPRFYFSRMHMVKPSAHRSLEENRKIKEEGKVGVDKFIEMRSYKGYPFHLITQEQWGFDLIQEVE